MHIFFMNLNQKLCYMTSGLFFDAKSPYIIQISLIYSVTHMGNNLSQEQLTMTGYVPQLSLTLTSDERQSRKIVEHRAWLNSIRHERPNTARSYKVGVYIRYYNQTKHQNYLSYHKKQYINSLSLCPKWSLVDFYVDEGAIPPNMESASEWSRLLEDCFNGKVDLILTQKVSNISRDMSELTICARLLAAQEHPVGIYFISEDIFTLASYYLSDLYDPELFPSDDWETLPDHIEEESQNDRQC